MKIKRSRIIILVVVIAAIVLIVFKLAGNKKEFQNDIAFAKRTIEKIPVAVETANKNVLSENVVATGTLEASDVLNLVSETQGKILKIYKEKGDYVATGDIIAKVDDEVIAANVLTAEANYAQFLKDVDRLTHLAEENAIAKRDLEQANIGLKKSKADLTNAQKALSNTSIKAPISGYINNDFITVGQLLGGGSPICEIVNNNTLKLNIRITENEVYKIKKGQDVAVHLTVFPDKKFTGHITSIAEKADAAMKFNIEITLANDVTAHLKSGLYAEAELPVKNEEKIIISKSSIVGSMESPIVYVVTNGKAVKREIIIGQSNDKQVEVLSGLSVGEQVIISGQLNLKDGDDVNIVSK
jgi:membrane fusion protein, multidrug efflux system